jgi:hypothetical protein
VTSGGTAQPCRRGAGRVNASRLHLSGSCSPGPRLARSGRYAAGAGTSRIQSAPSAKSADTQPWRADGYAAFFAAGFFFLFTGAGAGFFLDGVLVPLSALAFAAGAAGACATAGIASLSSAVPSGPYKRR